MFVLKFNELWNDCFVDNEQTFVGKLTVNYYDYKNRIDLIFKIILRMLINVWVYIKIMKIYQLLHKL